MGRGKETGGSDDSSPTCARLSQQLASTATCLQEEQKVCAAPVSRYPNSPTVLCPFPWDSCTLKATSQTAKIGGNRAERGGRGSQAHAATLTHICPRLSPSSRPWSSHLSHRGHLQPCPPGLHPPHGRALRGAIPITSTSYFSPSGRTTELQKTVLAPGLAPRLPSRPGCLPVSPASPAATPSPTTFAPAKPSSTQVPAC